MPVTVRVVLVESDPSCRELARSSLEGDGAVRVIGEAWDAWQAITKVQALRPDVVITDLGPPSLGGLEIVAWVEEQHSDVRVIILTAYEEPAYVTQALTIGAVAYIPKRSMIHELPLAVRHVLDGDVYVSPLLRGAAHRI